MTRSARKKFRIKLAVLAAAIAIGALSCWRAEDPANKTIVTLTGVDETAGENALNSGKDYGTFSHVVPEHAGIACDSCHGREGTKLKFAGHASCVDCHMGEFVRADSNICAICHTNSTENPAELKAFPAKFDEGFNVSFDHALHSRGAARPPQGCAACHFPQGAGRTISAGIGTHSQCFTCHTPESNIGSCNICHAIAPYARTWQAKSNVLGFAFSHADHNSVGCAECHSPRAGAMGRQITFPVAVEHFPKRGAITCATCHNDRRAFGEKDFANCRLCHEGKGFNLLPNGK